MYNRNFDLQGALDFLEKNEIYRAEIDYDGYGDNGSIDAVRAYNHHGSEFTIDNDVENALGMIAYTALSSRGIDWYNNEGGYGTVVIDRDEKAARIEHNVRIESSEYEEYSFS